MPPKRSNTLTEAELRIMRILWIRGESLVSDLVSAMPENTQLAYTSVLTTVAHPGAKGVTSSTGRRGALFWYSPCVAEHDASRSEIRHVLHRFFGNSREQLMLSLLGDGEITADELQRLKHAIAEAEAAADAEGA